MTGKTGLMNRVDRRGARTPAASALMPTPRFPAKTGAAQSRDPARKSARATAKWNSYFLTAASIRAEQTTTQCVL